MAAKVCNTGRDIVLSNIVIADLKASWEPVLGTVKDGYPDDPRQPSEPLRPGVDLADDSSHDISFHRIPLFAPLITASRSYLLSSLTSMRATTEEMIPWDGDCSDHGEFVDSDENGDVEDECEPYQPQSSCSWH